MEPETLQQIIEAVRVAGAPHWLEKAAWIGALALVVVAFLALGYAAKQVREMVVANKAAELETRATLLLKLDTRWNNRDLVDIQQDLQEVMDKIEAEAEKRWGHLDPKAIRDNSSELYAEKLREIRDSQRETYRKYMRLVDFLETLGYLAKMNYLPKDDLLNLFGGVIITFRRVFYHHLKLLQRKPGTTGRAWEYTIWLMDEVQHLAYGPKS